MDIIKDIFINNVKGKKYEEIKGHCGSEGHWLETLFGIKHNSSNSPDIYGYELKKGSQKISFGDWSADEYIFDPKDTLKEFNKNVPSIDRDEFMRIFGTYNNKKCRYSWSGKCIPKYGEYNNYGQILEVTQKGDILIAYEHIHDIYFKDKPNWLQNLDVVILAYWTKEKMERHINNKFNNKGFIICDKDTCGRYSKLFIGKKIDHNLWIDCLKRGQIFFDSGMYQGNSRKYSQWRAGHNFWKSLIIEEFQ